MVLKVIILGSQDGQEFAHAITTGEEVPNLDALQDVMRLVQQDDDWEWDYDMAPALRKAGYGTPEFIHGPVWD